MKKLIIEWRHLDVQGQTCERCCDTSDTLTVEVKRLQEELQPQGIEIVLTETKLDESRISQSNMILLNDVPLEDILNIKVSQNECDSCSDLLGQKTICRTVLFDGSEYEVIPAKAIRRAVYKVLGLEENGKVAEECGCQCGGTCC